MLTSTMPFSSGPNAVQAYAKNVGAAARGFVAALLAIKPETDAATTPPTDVNKGAPASDELSLYRLYRLASRSSSYDVVSPELVNELRLIAARG
jgi:hypothetical protein